MNDLPESNDIVKVSRGDGRINFIDDMDDLPRMSYEDIVNCHGQGVISDKVLLHNALLLLEESEARNAKCVAGLIALKEKLAIMSK